MNLQEMDEEEMDQEYPVAISRNDRFEISNRINLRLALTLPFT